MNGYEYICKTAAQFRKKFPCYCERKEGKPVFIDASFLNKIEDIPREIESTTVISRRTEKRKMKIAVFLIHCYTDYTIDRQGGLLFGLYQRVIKTSPMECEICPIYHLLMKKLSL